MKIYHICLMMMVMNTGCSATTLENHPKDVLGKPLTKEEVLQPKYKSKLTDKYQDACEIYKSSPLPSQGVHVYDGIVYVVIVFDTTKRKIGSKEGTAMLRSYLLLRHHYPSLPRKFSLPNKLVEKKFDRESGIYRYAVAYRLSSIKAASQNVRK